MSEGGISVLKDLAAEAADLAAEAAKPGLSKQMQPDHRGRTARFWLDLRDWLFKAK
jgi:hypothetical protein